MAEANTSVVISAVDKATEVINRITGQFDGLQSKWAGVVSALGVGAGVTALTSLIKNAIEAGDQMGDLAARVGISVTSLSNLQVAAKTSNTSIEEIASVLGKMSKNLMGVEDPGSNAAKALGVLGINAKAFAEAKVDDRLMMLADAAKGADNSTGALTGALDMLVKGGSALIPMIQGGSESLQEMISINQALGLSLTEDTAASMDKVSDTMVMMGEQSRGLGITLASKVLPTLEGLSKLWLDNAAAGNSFGNILATAIDYGLKSVVTVAITAGSALKGFGTILAGIMAAAAQFGEGKFRAGVDAFKQSLADASATSQKAGETVRQLWSNELPKFAAAEGELTKKIKERAKAMDDNEKSTKAAKAAADEYAKASKSVQDLTAKNLGVSNDYVQKLRDLELWYSKNTDKTEEYVQAVESLIRQQPFYVAGLKAQEEAQKAANKAAEDAIALDEKQYQEREQSIRKAREMVEAIQFEAAALKMTSTEREIATKLRELERAGVEKGSEAYRIFAERIENAVVSRDAVAANIKANEEIQENWKRTASQIEDALTKAMVDGFNNGKSVVRSIGEWIKNYFLTNIARSIAQALTGAITTGLSGLANASGLSSLVGGGSSGAAGGAGGGGGTLGMLSNLGSLFGAGGMTSFGMTGLMSTLTGTGLGTSLGAAGSLISGGNVLGGIGMGAGAIAPYALAAYAAYQLLSRNKSSPAQQNYTAIGSTDFGYSANVPNLQSSTAYQAVLNPIVSGVADIVAKLGGTLGNTSYGIYTSASPDGKGATLQVNAAGAGGELFRAWSNAANETLQQRIEATLPGLLLSGIKDANLPDEIAAVFRGLDVNTATTADIDRAIQQALELRPQEEAADHAQIDTYEAVQANSEVLLRQADLLDRLNTAVERLTEIAQSGLAATAEASADAGRQVVRAVMTLNPAEVNGGAL